MPSPTFDDGPRIGQTVEDLAVEQLVPELRVEAFAAAILPGTAGLDVRGSGADGRDPLPHRLGDELGAVVRPDVRRHAAQDEQVRQDVVTSTDLSLRSTWITRLSRVNSSITFSMRNFRPSCSAVPSAPPAAISARPAWRSPPSRHRAAAPRSGGSRSGHTGWRAPRCPPSERLRRRGPAAPCAVSSDAARGGTHAVPTPQASP